jgi:hypothetical protein
MFLFSHLKKTLPFGLPACVFFHRTTMFDLMLPRLLVGDAINQKGDRGYGQWRLMFAVK